MNTARPETEYWDALYRQPEYVYGTIPNQYLLQHTSRLKPGMKALVVGDGEGRNGVWLATQGLQVVSAERSPWGIAKARRLARLHKVDICFECCDLLDWTWPQEKFDVVVAMYLHLGKQERRKIHRNIVRCLTPGGWLVLEAFKRQHHRACKANSIRSNNSLFSAALLARDLWELEFLELLEGTVLLNEGCMHQGHAEVVRVLAQKR